MPCYLHLLLGFMAGGTLGVLSMALMHIASGHPGKGDDA